MYLLTKKKTVAKLCTQFELSPRGIGEVEVNASAASDIDTRTGALIVGAGDVNPPNDIDSRTGAPFIGVGDDGVISESLSSMDDESTAPKDVIKAVPNVKPVDSLKATTPLSLSKTQRKNLEKRQTKLKDACGGT